MNLSSKLHKHADLVYRHKRGNFPMSLGLLVAGFGAFIEDNAKPVNEPWTEVPFPADLAEIRHAVAHHLIPLALLARADGESVAAERLVIVDHCIGLATRLGTPITPAVETALKDYIDGLQPSTAQLGPALKKLEHDSHAEIDALLAAAQKLIAADGMVRAAEDRLLAQLRHDLAQL